MRFTDFTPIGICLLACCTCSWMFLYHQRSLTLMSLQNAHSQWKWMTYGCYTVLAVTHTVHPYRCLECPLVFGGPFNWLQWICLLIRSLRPSHCISSLWVARTDLRAQHTGSQDRSEKQNRVSILGRLMNVTLSALIAGCPAGAEVIVPNKPLLCI